jgi:hypothetical protein
MNLSSSNKSPQPKLSAVPPQPAAQNPDRVSVSYGEKVNMGNYESTDCSASYSSDVQPGETAAQAHQRCFANVKRFVDAALDRLVAERKGK